VREKEKERERSGKERKKEWKRRGIEVSIVTITTIKREQKETTAKTSKKRLVAAAGLSKTNQCTGARMENKRCVDRSLPQVKDERAVFYQLDGM